jgi:hypothetical protein
MICKPAKRTCARPTAHSADFLPAVPRTNSHHSTLTSVHATNGRGPYGNASFPGNCSGLFIRDLLIYYRPKRVLDPMTGSGTCRDVCKELHIECHSYDLTTGFDAADSKNYATLEAFDFVWLHPPYFRMISYNEDWRCLSNAASLDGFLFLLRTVMRNCKSVLSRDGRLAILIGDGKEDGRYLALPFRTFALAEEERLTLAAPEIIRLSHGTSSARKRYSTNFIPRVHDVCLVLRHA